MSPNLFNLTYEMLEESSKCSKFMDLVPRPMTSPGAPAKWLAKQVRKALIRKLKDNKAQYAICVSAVASKMKTKFHMTGNGV